MPAMGNGSKEEGVVDSLLDSLEIHRISETKSTANNPSESQSQSSGSESSSMEAAMRKLIDGVYRDEQKRRRNRTQQQRRQHIDPSSGVLFFSMILLLAIISSNAWSVNATSIIEQQSTRLLQRQEEDKSIEYGPCNLCMGQEILKDKIPGIPLGLEEFFPDFLNGNQTCAETSLFYENFGPILFPNRCRANEGFNKYFEACCRAPIPTYTCEQNIHAHMSSLDYDPIVPPIVGPDQPLNVSVALVYQAVTNVDAGDGSATVFMTITLTWEDPRLKWEIDDEKCSNSVSVWTGHDQETTSIWIPDWDLMNRVEGVQSFPQIKAELYADGSVSWVITGGLKAFCAYTGLAKVPFDTLGCQFLFGAETRGFSDSINYVLQDPEYMVFGSFDVTYNEFRIIPELGRQGYVADETFIYYNVFFQRASTHYINTIVVPNLLLTIVSFLQYFMDVRIGERMGFSLTICLVLVASQIIATQITPISNESLWLEKFVTWSFYWVLAGVLQTVMIGFLFYLREDAQEKANKKETRRAKGGDEEEEPLTLGMMERKPSVSADEESSTPLSESSVHKFLYTFPLRKVDLVCFFFAIVSYASFLSWLFISGIDCETCWLANDPKWFNESTVLQPSIYHDGVLFTKAADDGSG